MVLALKVNDKDNVATIFAEQVQGGDAIQVRDKKGETIEVKALEAVPYGHKIALQDIAKGQIIVKYGEEIGMASADIRKGEHVHVHNLESMTGIRTAGRRRPNEILRLQKSRRQCRMPEPGSSDSKRSLCS